MKKNNYISCIIPAYNEEERIENVIKASLQSKLINEIIIVDDGSKDNTLKKAQKYKSSNVKIYNNKVNKGKTDAILYGISKSKKDIILFIDADIKGLTGKIIDKFIEPVASNDFDIVIMERIILFFNKRVKPIENLLHFSFISGERCLKYNSFEPFFSSIKKDSRYALEVKMNQFIINKELKYGSMFFKDVHQVNKFMKLNLLQWVVQDSKALRDMKNKSGLSIAKLVKLFKEFDKKIIKIKTVS